MNIDFYKLKADLIDYLGTAYYAGYGMAIVDMGIIENATEQQLISIAVQYGFDLDNYKILSR